MKTTYLMMGSSLFSRTVGDGDTATWTLLNSVAEHTTADIGQQTEMPARSYAERARDTIPEAVAAYREIYADNPKALARADAIQSQLNAADEPTVVG